MQKLPKLAKATVTLDLSKLIILLLSVGILVMLIIWKPWATVDPDRTIQVTGETTLTAEPDEYVFYPTYQFKNTDKTQALAELSAKSDEIVAQLKERGVDSSKIKVNSNGTTYGFSRDGDNTPVYMLSLTITAANRDLAQDIQNYLVTTQPLGAVSPQTSLSDAQRKQLETRARDEAINDARAKAEQHARNAGLRITGVKTLTEGQGFDGGPIPLRAASEPAIAGDAVASNLAVQPGENKLHFAVTVTYFVR